MTDNEISTVEDQRGKILALGSIIGALVGLGAAYLILQRMDEQGELKISSREGVKLGISIFTFFRQITQLGD
jgi:hypothetical protein